MQRNGVVCVCVVDLMRSNNRRKNNEIKKKRILVSIGFVFGLCVCVRCACATVYVPVSSAFWVEPQQRDETRERARDLDGSD